MENTSRTITNLVLLGVVEMHNLRYLYAILAIVMYVITMVLCALIVYVVWSETSLHEPMYIFIGNLVANVMFGSSSVLPKLVVDLLFGFHAISLPGCLIQAFCVQSFSTIELTTLTVMSYDRFLAINDPLRYPILMTNSKAFKLLLTIFIWVYVFISIVVILAGRLALCGEYIKSIFCETMSLLPLACGDISINNIFGMTGILTLSGSCILLVAYCYIRTFIVCLKFSSDAYQKAIHTLVTNIFSFTTFQISSLFVILRYRLGTGSQSIITHVVISIAALSVSVTINPLVYGIRTEALRVRIVSILQNVFKNFTLYKSKLKG